MNQIRQYVGNNKIWVSIDESTDIDGRYVGNVIIGTLKVNKAEGIKRENILLFVSDAAPYMIKAGKTIKVLYSKCQHLTCLAHALHRVAEEIRAKFPEVNELISNCKKIFLKSPYRIQRFRNILPEVPLPPEPILTRWGTWLSAVNYYCENYDGLKSVIFELNSEDATCVANAQRLFEKSNLETNLIYIKANFGFLSMEITRLETSGLLLTESLKII
ncbi:hypothetical protein QTP88_000243 [Uroleucon formosanum]